jgi:hypothetical protein
MANPPVTWKPLTTATFLPVEATVRSYDIQHGAKTTLHHQRYVTPVKLEFNIPSSQNTFTINKAHQEVLQLMKDKDPTLEIVPSKEGKAKFTNL